MCEVTSSEIKKLEEILDRANRTGSLQVDNAKERLRSCIEAGQLLTTIKQKLPHGQWQRWFADNIEERFNFSIYSAKRWMRLYDHHTNGRFDASNPRSLLQAYKLAGIVPDAPEAPGQAAKATPSFIMIAQRFSGQCAALELDTLSFSQRQALADVFPAIISLGLRICAR